jgi:hypothetical protein
MIELILLSIGKDRKNLKNIGNDIEGITHK